ncbi:MAG: hypothetical protein ACYDCM_07730 [Candidatus Acidiferrales bacterium]
MDHTFTVILRFLSHPKRAQVITTGAEVLTLRLRLLLFLREKTPRRSSTVRHDKRVVAGTRNHCPL